MVPAVVHQPLEGIVCIGGKPIDCDGVAIGIVAKGAVQSSRYTRQAIAGGWIAEAARGTVDHLIGPVAIGVVLIALVLRTARLCREAVERIVTQRFALGAIHAVGDTSDAVGRIVSESQTLDARYRDRRRTQVAVVRDRV